MSRLRSRLVLTALLASCVSAGHPALGQAYYPDDMDIVGAVTSGADGSGTDVDSAWETAYPGSTRLSVTVEGRCEAIASDSAGGESLAAFRQRVLGMASEGGPVRPSVLAGCMGALGEAQNCPDSGDPEAAIRMCRLTCGFVRADARWSIVVRGLLTCAATLGSPDALQAGGATNAGLAGSIFADPRGALGNTFGESLLAEGLGTCTPDEIEAAFQLCIAACEGAPAPPPVCADPLRTLVASGRATFGPAPSR